MSACSRVLSAAALVASILAASAAPAAAHEDPRIGYSFKEPSGWTEIPLQQNETWVVAKYLSDKKYSYTDPDQGYTILYQPTLEVIAFLDEVINKKDLESEEGEDDEVKVRLIEPYHDYKDYMKRTFTGGGYYFDVEETVDFHGADVDAYEIKVEKGTHDGPKRIVTWVYPIEAGHVAIQFEVLEDSVKKMEPLIKHALRSFDEIERTEDFDISGRSGNYVSFRMLWEMAPEQRKLRRQEMERISWQQATENLPEGWRAKEFDGVNVLTREDDRHAKKVVEHVHAVRNWLEDNFPSFGAGEYTRLPIIRICKDADEENAFRQGTPSFGGLGLEIVTHKGTGGAADSEWGWVNERVLDYWLADRDQTCTYAMPAWLRIGLGGLVSSADVKGKKLRFREGDLEQYLRLDAKGDEKMLTAKDLLLMGNREFIEQMKQQNWKPYMQSTALVRFFVDGPASRSKRTRTLLPDYLANLHQVMVEIEKEEEAANEGKSQPEPKTEQEEEEAQKKRRQELEAKEARILKEVLDRSFDGWSDSDWESFEEDYAKFLD